MGLPVASLQQLEAAVATVCSQTWSEVRPAPSSRASWVGPSCLLVIPGFYRWSGQGLSASPLK